MQASECTGNLQSTFYSVELKLVTFDMKQSFDLYFRSLGHTIIRVLSITLIMFILLSVFSSPELKAQVSFSDRPLSGVRLSVRPSVRPSVCPSVCL
jgi:hypothetical protein